MRDAMIITVSIAIAVAIIRSDFLIRLLTSAREVEILGSFIAGAFFTSAFTTAPAIVTLGEIARANSLWVTAFFGALGSVVGDLLIFTFFRDQFSEHIKELITHESSWKRTRALFRLRTFRWLAFFIGGLIIASPLPDELGIGLLGFARMNTRRFVALSFTFNFIGIIVIGLIARAL